VPLLAVEVRSPSTVGRDAVLKRREYARLGIASYWLLDVDVPSLRVFELAGPDYAEVGYAEGDTPMTVEQPFPVTVVPADLLRL
jgi:Uma2 family endonuclease